MRRTTSAALGCFGLAAAVALLSTQGVALTPIKADPSAVGVALRSLPLVFALCVPALLLVGLAQLRHGQVRRRSDWGQRWVERLVALPPWVLVLPVSLCASYIVTRINFSTTTDAPFRTGFALWASAIALFLISFASRQTWQSLRTSRVAPRHWFNLQQSDVGLIILLAVAAFALRIAFLDHAPLIHGDEETLGEESMRVLRGVIKNMFTAGWEGLPSLNFFVISFVYRVFGIGIFAVRFVSAVAGTAAVVVTYIAFRELFGRGRALVAALFMTAYHFHLQFSRTGFTNVGDTLVMPAAIYFTYRAARAQRSFDFAALGLVCGFGLYVYSTTRAVPLVMAVFFLLLIVFQRGFLRASWRGMLLAAAAFCIVGLPIGTFFLSRPDVFAGRLSSVGVFWSGWYERQIILGNTPTSIFWDQLKHAFGVFVYYPVMSNAGLYLPSLPLIPGWSAVPFLIGAAYTLLHVWRKEYLLVLLSLVIPTLLGGVLTIPATSWQRFLGTIPAVCAFVSIGLWQAAALLFFWRPSFVPTVAVAAVVVLAAQNAHIYFGSALKDKVFGPPLRWVTVQYVRELPTDTRVYWYGAPWAYAGLAATSLYDRQLIDVFDAAPHALLPVDHPSPSVYLFMAHREDELPALQEQCPGGTTRILKHLGDKVLLVYELLHDNTCLPKLEPPPANDKFANATVVRTLPFTDTISAKAATLDEHEPQPGPPKPADSLPCGGTNNTAWYAFTSDSDIRVTAKTVGTTSGTLVGVFEGSELTSLVPVACNALTGEPHTAHVDFVARAGVPYRLQVATKTYAVGTLTFTLEPSPPDTPAEEGATVPAAAPTS
jgi:4-amino-4-deoxy-L-arabinose transferase-like glycosyltransferase